MENTMRISHCLLQRAGQQLLSTTRYVAIKHMGEGEEMTLAKNQLGSTSSSIVGELAYA